MLPTQVLYALQVAFMLKTLDLNFLIYFVNDIRWDKYFFPGLQDKYRKNLHFYMTADAVPVGKIKLFYLSATSAHTSHGENPNKEVNAPVSKENHRGCVSTA